MSYILDALKKAERERRSGSVPDLLTTHEKPSRPQGHRMLWAVIIAAALLLNAGALLWWLGPLKSDKPAVAPSGPPAANLSKPDSPTAVQPDAKGTIEESQVDQKRSSVPKSADVPKGKAGPGTTGPAGQVDGKAADKTTEKTRPGPPSKDREAPAVPSPEPPPDRNRLYQIGELPPSVRQGLPSIAIQLSMYSDEPASRLVRINDRVLKEGNYLTEGLKVEEIGREYVIFSYHGYRFRVAVR